MNLINFRFSRDDLMLKPGRVSGQSALCLVYADTRAYQDALDSFGIMWGTTVQAVGPKAAIVTLTIDGVTRSASGEDTDFMSAEARAFKRACSAWGLGRYIYDLDLGYQPWDGKKFGQAAYNALTRALKGVESPPDATGDAATPDGKAQGQKTPQGASVPATADDDSLGDELFTPQKPKASKKQLDTFELLGKQYYGDEWPEPTAKLCQAASKGEVSDPAELLEHEIGVLLAGLQSRITKRKKVAA